MACPRPASAFRAESPPRRRAGCSGLRGLMGLAKRRGRGLTSMDGLIAATAIAQELTLATPNMKDFEGFGIELFRGCVNRPAPHPECSKRLSNKKCGFALIPFAEKCCDRAHGMPRASNRSSHPGSLKPFEAHVRQLFIAWMTLIETNDSITLRKSCMDKSTSRTDHPSKGENLPCALTCSGGRAEK